MLKLWQKYKIFDVEIMDKLFRISATSKIDSVINSANNSLEETNIADKTSSTLVNTSTGVVENSAASERQRKKHVEDEDLRRLNNVRDQLLSSSPSNKQKNHHHHHHHSPYSTANEISKVTINSV